ncbi:MAG: hypothetical protein NXH90_02675 [Flavobacteriaceae bacterium]|nr:hypothetical protein [Flavobacteriaceae bacterium]
MIGPIRAIGLMVLWWSIQSCSHGSNQEADLLGVWKVDSTFTYYNGFSYMQRDEGSDWAIYDYNSNGVLREIKHGSFLNYRYHLAEKSDTLLLESTQGGQNTKFVVLELTKDRLVLKKDKNPIFEGKDQHRYEIRYFSRSKDVQDSLIPFRDPRKIDR